MVTHDVFHLLTAMIAGLVILFIIFAVVVECMIILVDFVNVFRFWPGVILFSRASDYASSHEKDDMQSPRAHRVKLPRRTACED